MQVNLNISNISIINRTFGSNNINSEPSSETDNLKSLFDKKIKQYPKDLDYFKTLAQNIKLPEQELYKLYPIIGPQQLEDILRRADEKFFYPGTDIPRGTLDSKILKQIAERNYHFNLHMHTTNSDGEMTVSQLLNQAVEYANIQTPLEYAPSFVVAITDHDTFEGSKAALEEIASNPLKYKKLGVVLGAELSSIFRDGKVLQKPVTFEFVAYSINPYDEPFNEHLAKLRAERINLSKQLVLNAQNLYPQYNFSYDELCQTSKNPKKGIDGFLYGIKNYFSQKAQSSKPERHLLRMCDSYMPSIKQKTGPKLNSEPEELFGFMQNTFGFLGISHPGKIYLGDGRLKDEFIQQCEQQGQNAGKITMNRFYRHMANIGKSKFKAIETNYQGYKDDLKKAYDIMHNRRPKDKTYDDSIQWLQNIQDYAKQYNLLNAGGLDTHKENPFLRN